jgi:tetratricopeptide (TPR) repeat protein
MSARVWLVTAGVIAAILFGPLAYFYATLPPRLEILGPSTPESPTGVAFIQGSIAQQRHDYQKAVDIYTDYLARESNTNWYARVILEQRAAAYEQLGQIESAEADFTAAIKLAPRSFAYSTYAARGLFYARLNRDADALADFKTGARFDPTSGEFAYSEGLMYQGRGNYPLAVQKFDEAIRLEPKKRKYYMERGSAHNHAGKYDEGRADFTQALALSDKHISDRETVRANLGRGYAELQLGLFQPAIDDFDVVLKVVPRASNALAWQGSAYEGIGDQARAIVAYQAALAIDPDHEHAAKKLKALQPAQP